MLTVHVLAHSPSPTKLLKDCYDRLQAGGRIFILDKDVTEPRPDIMKFALSGNAAIAHCHHLTFNSLRAFVRKAGFEIERAEYLDRSPNLRHMLVVGRKPAVAVAIGDVTADDPQRVHDRLVFLYRLHLLRAPVRLIRRRLGRNRIKMLRSTFRHARKRTEKWFRRLRAA
jgi:hypothetical protein